MSLTMNSTGGSKSQRIASQRKILDEASRKRRARKALESLEADNFHDDPHADLVMSKKALNLFQEVQHGSDHTSPSASNTSTTGSLMGSAINASSGTAPKPPKRRLKTAEYYKQRFRKNFSQLLEEDATQNEKEEDKCVNYIAAQAPPSKKPQRHFCAVCGFPSKYCCTVCGARFCSLPCQDTHQETRCLKYTA